MNDVEQLKAVLKATEESIAAGLRWDREQGHSVYGCSAQARNDREMRRALKKKIAALAGAGPVKMVAVMPRFRG